MISTIKSLWGKPHVRRGVQITYISLIVVFVAAVIYANRSVFTELTFNTAQIGLLLLALIATLLRRLAGGLRWLWLVKYVGRNTTVPPRESLKVYFIANLGTYIPGTYWFIPGRMVMNAKQGITAFETGVSTILEQYLLIVSGALVSIFGINLVADIADVSISGFWWLGLVLILGFFAIHPKSIRLTTNVMARVLRTEPIQTIPQFRILLLLMLWSVVIWLLGGLSLYYLVRVFAPEVGWGDFATINAIFAVSWLVGFFTPFAPSGIGVREGILGTGLIALGLPPGTSVVLTALSRLLILIEDLTWGAISLWL